MSLSINHPLGRVSSTTALSFEVQGGSATAPKNINLSASSVIMPNVQQPVGTSGAMIFDASTKRMKYYDGTQWISWLPSTEITDPIETDLTDIRNKLNTKIDSVIYSSSAVPTASISGTTLYINFPTGGSSSNTTPGLFTSLPTGSISHYALVSGQTPASVREQLGGSVGSQNGRDGSQAAPYITSTGWTFSDGLYWQWNGPNGVVVTKVPNLNQNAYMKGMSTSGITKTDSVISSSGSISGTSLTVSQLPPINFTVNGTTTFGGGHVHKTTWNPMGWSGTSSVKDGRGVSSGSGSLDTEYAGDHSHTFNGTTNTIGSGISHSHVLQDVDVGHFNVAVLWNMATPSLALNQEAGDARYVLKAGDTMTGSLTIANAAVLRGSDSNLVFWFRNTDNSERAVIYHAGSTLRFRSNGGNEMSLSNSGLLTAPQISTPGTVTGSQVTSNGNANVAGTLSANALSANQITSNSNANVAGTMTAGAVVTNQLISYNTLQVNGSATTGTLNVNGQITATGDIWAFSDERLKENIKPILNAKDTLSQITGILGNMIEDETKTEKSMVIAQQIQAVFPQAVSTDDNGYLKVNYIALIPLLIAGYNELLKGDK